MLICTKLQTEPKRADHKRGDQCGEDRMRRQNGQINGPCEALAGEFGRSKPKVIGPKRVVADIGDQKSCGYRARGQHAETVFGDLAGLNEVESRYQKNAARGVQSGVQMRKNAEKIHLWLLPEAEHHKKHDPEHADKVPIPTNSTREIASIFELRAIVGLNRCSQNYRPQCNDTS
jgi:hypothetical protein